MAVAVWLEGELLVSGPPGFAEAVVWKTPWPVQDPEGAGARGAVLVVPSIQVPIVEGVAPSGSPPYVALITGAAPLSWRGTELIGPVLQFDADLFRTGDHVRVEGITSRIELPNLEEVPVVTSFLENRYGEILLLRRSNQVGTFRGYWAGVSGFFEAETAEAQAYQEILEETGVTSKDLHLERAGPTVHARDGRRIFSVHPFRFRTETRQIRLDWEHTEAEWVDPLELGRREIVPKLDRVWAAVRPEGNA
ncbi:MAG: NUDIX domain-containing protein [Thermoplasmata archaeon]|nr:NUDIX domain-containing protein [Thermoplasmata archaeon]